MNGGFLRTALVLGLLSVVGPFAIDMVLPALPDVARDLGASEAEGQKTIIWFFVAFGIAQLFWGPFADARGRKAPLFIGLFVFWIASIGCALARSMEMLIALRFIQGLGASVVMVVPRAIIRDLHTGTEATRLMAMIMLVSSISPMLAPLVGSGLLVLGDWRLIFWAIAAATLVSLAVTLFLQPETLPPAQRVPINVATMRNGAATLIRSPRYMGLTLVGGLAISSFLVYLAMAPFVLQGMYGLSPTGFSLAFATNAAGFFGASQLAAPLGARLGMDRLVRLGCTGFFVFNLLLVGLALAGLASLPVFIACLFVATGFVGIVLPSAMVMSLDEHGAIAGLAASLGGTMQMLVGGVISTLTGRFHDGTVLPMALGMLFCALGALVLALIVPAERKSPLSQMS